MRILDAPASNLAQERQGMGLHALERGNQDGKSLNRYDLQIKFITQEK
jgi:hypothetical protein